MMDERSTWAGFPQRVATLEMLSPRVISLLPHSMACALASQEIEARTAAKMSRFIASPSYRFPGKDANARGHRSMRRRAGKLATNGRENEVNSVACPLPWASACEHYRSDRPTAAC